MVEAEKLTPEEALAQLEALAENDDYESAHIEADGILCALLQFCGHSEIVEAYNKVGKWYA